jgi:predicted O-methyltransferase YrrM
MGRDVKIILELGSWLGRSTRWMAEQSPNAVVLAIDHWQGSVEHHATPEWRAMLPTLYVTFIKNCWTLKDRVVPVRMDTVLGMQLVHRHAILPDLVFIDAGHDYVSARADLSNALGLFPHAILCGDDFMWEGVARTVTEHVRSGIMRGFVKGNVWWRENPAFEHIRDGIPI